MMSKISKPRTKWARTIVGSLLIIGGIFGFLPVLGFWMIPLGLVILSSDYPFMRRLRRRLEVRFGRVWARWKEERR